MRKSSDYYADLLRRGGISAEPVHYYHIQEDAEVIRIGTLALRLQLVTMPFQAWVIMVNMLTQSIGYGFRASAVAMGRQGLFLIPSLLIFPRTMGLLGLQISQPVADMLTFVLATAIVTGVLKELKQMREREAVVNPREQQRQQDMKGSSLGNPGQRRG